jgi:small subunit ribosomal protein S16
MALKIRLRRMGRKKAPHYRIVIAESSMPRDGRFVATIGHYNPTTQPATLKVDRDKAAAWMAKGAVPTDTVRALLRKAGVGQAEGAGAVETAVAAVKGAAAKTASAARGAAAKVAEAATAVAAAATEAVEAVVEKVTGGDEPAAEAPAEETPAAEAPAEETAEAPAEETPAAEAPADAPAAEETPAAEGETAEKA